MGGRIWVQSSGVPGQGSAFHVVLPMPSAEQQAEPGVRMSLKRVTTEVPASVE
jgi:hypothetical protein